MYFTNKFLVICGMSNFFSVLKSNDSSTSLSLCFNFQPCCLRLVQLKDMVSVQLAQAATSVLTTLEPWQLIPTIWAFLDLEIKKK